MTSSPALSATQTADAAPVNDDSALTLVAPQPSSDVQQISTRSSQLPEKDDEQYATMMRRCLRAYGKRVVASDASVLADLAALRDLLDEVTGRAARTLNADGVSWSQIGLELNVTKSAAFQRYGKGDVGGFDVEQPGRYCDTHRRYECTSSKRNGDGCHAPAVFATAHCPHHAAK
jgi:hypothetical protein